MYTSELFFVGYIVSNNNSEKSIVARYMYVLLHVTTFLSKAYVKKYIILNSLKQTVFLQIPSKNYLETITPEPIGIIPLLDILWYNNNIINI